MMFYQVNHHFLSHPSKWQMTDLYEEWLKFIGLPLLPTITRNYVAFAEACETRRKFMEQHRPISENFIRWLVTQHGFTVLPLESGVEICDEVPEH